MKFKFRLDQFFTSRRILVLSFLFLIISGTLLFSLSSIYNGEKISLIDRIFTATSATCVTGLTVIDVGTKFNFWGQLILLTLIQFGGLGLMTFSTLFILIIGKKILFREKLLLQEGLNRYDISNITSLLKYLTIFTFTMESIGAVILYSRWSFIKDNYFRIFTSIFHSISAFCNAGFSLYNSSLIKFYNDPVIILTITFLIIFGGLGFFVNFELRNIFLHKLNKIQKLFKFKLRYHPLNLSLHSKVVITTSLILILSGMFLLFIFEYNGVLKGKTFTDSLSITYFQSVTSRTAGFNTINIYKLSNSSLLILIVLMFIGGSPGSTAGGIKTTTFATLYFVLRSILHGHKNVVAYYRTINDSIVRRALSIFLLSLNIIFISFLIILAIEGRNFSFIEILFEVVSAFGTVGLSTGITPFLSTWSKIVIIILMFIGRVGPLTIAVSIFEKETGDIRYPEENISVG